MKVFFKKVVNHFYMFGLAIKNCKIYLPVIVAYIFLDYIAQFILIIFPAVLINHLAEGKTFKEIFPLIVMMSSLYFLAYFVLKSLTALKTKLEYEIQLKLNNQLSSKCMSLDYSSLESDDLINTVDNARIAINGGLTYAQASVLNGAQGFSGYFSQLSGFISNVLKVINLLYILRKLEFWVIVVIFISLILNVVFTNIKKKFNIQLRNYATPYIQKDRYCQRIFITVEAGKDIRLFDMPKFLINKSDDGNKKYIIKRNTYRNKIILAESLMCANSAFVVLSVFISLILLYKTDGLQVGMFSMISTATVGLYTCGTSMINQVMDLEIHSYYMAALKKLMKIKNTVSDGMRRLENKSHKIVFEHVSYSYSHSFTKALDDVSITINEGETVSIVGRNGAGKSTFIKLLIGLYRPTNGNIYIDDVPIDQYKKEDLLNYMGVLFQDFCTYDMSVQENVTLSDMYQKDSLKNSMEKSGLITRVNKMKYGENTFIGYNYDDYSEYLSGGEQQKMAMSRVFYKSPKLIILDEPTSALDAKSEEEVYKTFLHYAKNNQTVLFISHRMASSKICNRIVVFDKGKIVESGSHKELMQLKGLYATMWEKQAKYYGEEND